MYVEEFFLVEIGSEVFVYICMFVFCVFLNWIEDVLLI